MLQDFGVEQGRPRHPLHADGAGGGDRACWPARASAPCIRWCSAASPPRSSRPASTTPSRRSSCRASCGIEPGRIVHYKPLLDEAIELATHKPDACLILQRPQAEATHGRRPRPRLGRRCATRRWCGRKSAATACRSPPPIRSTSSTPPAPPAVPKGVVRDNGGHMVALKWSMKNLYGIEPGEVFWAASDVGWVVGHTYIVYAPLLHGCTTILYEGKPVGTPDAGAFWRVIAEHGCVAHVHRADRVPRHQEGGPAGQAASRSTTCRTSARCSWPASAPTPTRSSWAENAAQGAGDRPLVADRDRLGDRRQSGRARPAAGQARLADRADAGLRRARGRRAVQGGRRRNQMGSIVVKLPLPPVVPADAVAAGRALPRELPRPSSPATTRPRTPASWTRTATSTSWAAPTTSSTSPATGSRPAAWRRCWPRTRTSPNAP